MKKRVKVLVIMLIISLMVPGNLKVLAEDTSQTLEEPLIEDTGDVDADTLEEPLIENENTGDVDADTVEPDDMPSGATEEAPSGEIVGEEDTENNLSVVYQSHVQKKGWQNAVYNGQLAGTTGKGLRMEAIAINLELENQNEQEMNGTPSIDGGIEYQTHVSSIGWQSNWTSGGNIAGTVGRGLQMEAIRIRLTGNIADQYDIYYSTHVASYGWLNWASNGASAGSQGKGKQVEAIKIVLVKKGETPPENLGTNEQAFLQPLIRYRAHVSTNGWMAVQEDGKTAGTTGQGKQMEAIYLSLYNPEYSGDVQYRTHCANIGWSEEWQSNGAIGGTTGRGLQMEAIQIQLTGDMSSNYDIYYRVHIARFGWLGWTSNGEIAGSVGYASAIEAIQVVLYPKGSADVPSIGTRSSISANQIGGLTYGTYVQDLGWRNDVSSGEIAGTTGSSKRIESIHINTKQSEGGFTGGIQYLVHVQDEGWIKWGYNGEDAGNAGSGKRIEAIQIKLTGELENYVDIYYQAHIDNYGWLGWAKNGQTAGSTDIGYRLQALRIKIVPKGTSAPGSTSGYFTSSPYRTMLSTFSTVSTNNANGTYNMARALAQFNGVVLQPGQTLSFNGTTGYCGQENGYLLAGVVGGVGYGGGICQASTTLYGAAIRAGLTIVERRNHTIASTYVPRGLDAMVDWGSSDLKFRNDLGYPVTIYTRTVGNVLTAEMYGTRASWYDEIRVESWLTGIHTASARRVYYKNGVAVRSESLPDSYYFN